MYSVDELKSLQSQIRKRMVMIGVPAALLLALQVYFVINRQQTPTVILAVILCFGMIFFFGNCVLPLTRYQTHLNNMLKGRKHVIQARFLSLDRDESLVDGVLYRAMHVLCKDDSGKDYERLFYWDLQKPVPELQEQTLLEITYHDREIADLSVVG